MTRFKNALLNELVTYARLPSPAVDHTPSPHRRIVRIASLAGVAAAAAIAVFVVAPTGTPPAYAIEKNPDGTVSVTFRELGQTAQATRDLRAAGVAAQVVRLANPGSCATTPGGIPFEPRAEIAYSIDMPSLDPRYGDITGWLKDSAQNVLTIDASAIPPGAVVFIIEHSSPDTDLGFTAGLVNAPAPTCWEAKEQSPPPPLGEMVPSPAGMPSPVPSSTP